MKLKLQDFYKKYWDFVLDSAPTLATILGYSEYNDRLPDISESHHFEQIEKVRQLYRELQGAPPQTPDEKVNHHILTLLLEERMESEHFYSHLLPLNPLFGPHLDLPQVFSCQPLKTEKDLGDYFSRLKAVKTLILQAIELMETGIKKEVVLPKILIEKCLPQVESHIKEDPTDSIFFKPLLGIEGFSEEQIQDFQKEGAEIVQDYIVPVFQKLHDFLKKTYLPQGKDEVGLWSLPKGQEEYKFWIRHHTTTALTAEEIHEIGKQELAEIHERMEAIKQQLGFEGTLKEFMEKVRSDPQFYYDSEEELLKGYRDILEGMKEKLPELFKQLPQADYEVKPIEAFRAEAGPEGFYMPGPLDRSRPGTFFVNTSKLESRPKYQMEVLAYHEAIPGHHLQLSLAQEMDLPDFRRVGIFTGYAEGWGLYSELLPKEVGLYQDPYSDLGRLIFDAWRATRLIVDTGLHHFKWTRQQAIDFCMENTGLTEHNIISEVDRYISYPGQALAYKIGQRKILELRQKAKEKLGSAFDIKEFHHKVLEHGGLPLSILESLVEDWLRKEAA